MPTHELLNGLSGNLQSSDSWSRQQALDMIRSTLARSLGSLTATEQREYVRLQRAAHQSLLDVEHANAAIISTFKTDGLAQLRAKLGGLDPEQIFLHTRYLEKVDHPLPWESVPVEEGSRRRFRRAYDAWKYRAHVSRMSLWDAACLNFELGTGVRQESGYTFIDATYLSGVEPNRLSTAQFIDIARDLNLNAQLQNTLAATLGQGGQMRQLIEASSRACLLFETLEAYRDRASSGVSKVLYDKLVQAIEGTGPALEFETLGMSTQYVALPAVPFVPSGTTIPMPLLVIRVASLGVLSYFPFRPGGALRYHIDAQSAGAQFIEQLKDSHRKGDLGWFSRQLPISELAGFKHLQTTRQRPPHLWWGAAAVYDAFHWLVPERTLDDLRFTPDTGTGRTTTLVRAYATRQVQLYQSNLSTLATTRSERDLQALISGAAALAGEILQLLLIPVPGGVTGLNRTMQLVALGSLTYSAIIGVHEATRGEANEFAAALADVADLAVSGLLISTAGQVHRQRLNRLLQQLGNPRKVARRDGTHELWKPDIDPYAIVDQRLLTGMKANAQGVYSFQGKHYVWLVHNSHRKVAEVNYDASTLSFVLMHKNGASYAPPIIFDPAQQAWVLDLHNAHTLSDIQLTERMLPNGSTSVPTADMEIMLRSVAPTRAELDAVWAGEPAPVSLTEGVRRLQIDQVIRQIISDFHRRGHMPPHADSTVLCLLTQLPEWPAGAVINVHDQQGQLIETYAKEEPVTGPQHPINLKRRDDGTYIELNAPATTVVSQEQLFELLIDAQPAASTLGNAGSPHLTRTQRIARVRLQISELAQARRLDLYSAMTTYAGYDKTHLPTDHAARAFLPTKAASPLVEVTPLLKKLHERYAPLTPPNLQQLLALHPLDAAQRAKFLQDASLPQALAENLEHHRTALRINIVIDALYHPRAFSTDIDQWAREFASSLLSQTLDRTLVVTEVVDGVAVTPYVSSGPDDTTVELRHYGEGRYEAYDLRNAGTIPVDPGIDSFYLAIGSVLQPHERLKLGMQSASDAQGLRKTLGDQMSAQRSPEGYVSLLDQSLRQYEHTLILPPELRPNNEGVYEVDDQRLLPLYGSLYAITFDNRVRKWRLKHPEKVGVDTPLLEQNRRGAWRLSIENPLTWDDHQLVYRLGSENYAVDKPTATRILSVTDTPSRALREAHCANLAPPPLLEDTSKRFRIERDLVNFIQAMTAYSANRYTQPSLQLLIACSLPTWPASHALEIIDDRGGVIARYPATAAADVQTIRINRATSRGPEPLTHVVKDDALIQTLLGELPPTQEERMFKLARQIADYAYQERGQLFDILYAQSERGGNALEQRFKAQHPGLPDSAVKTILNLATPKELQQLRDTSEVGLRLSEQAQLTAHDLRLNRAFEGLYLNTLVNPDSDKITLHMLKSLPGWPADLRVDIHQSTAEGAVVASAGHLAGTQRKRLAKVDSRYWAYDSLGNVLNEPMNVPTDLLSAISLLLTDTECAGLDVIDRDDLAPLQNSVAEAALGQRVAIKALLELPHIPAWLQPPMQVDSSFLAYPFSLRQLWPFGGNRPVDLVSKVRELYPSFRVADANDLIRSLNLSEPALLIELQRRKAEYRAMDFGLERWTETLTAIDDPATDPQGVHQAQRRRLADKLRKAWRREIRAVNVDGLRTFTLTLRLDGNDLPDVDFMQGLRGFEHINYLRIIGNTFPPTGNAFLGKFSHLDSLKIECALPELPTSITDMSQLKYLYLNNNNITLNEEARQRLRNLTRLRLLNLNDNPLGIPPDVTTMLHLDTLLLRNTEIDQWPPGATLLELDDLHLQGNRITTVPDELFVTEWMESTNERTLLHDNPLSADTLQRIADYRRRTGIALGGQLPGNTHIAPTSDDVGKWLAGVPSEQHARRKTLWAQLQRHEDASPEDTFRVLRDLTQAYGYNKNETSRQALTRRVWNLLDAMGQSTELRNKIFLSTYCGRHMRRRRPTGIYRYGNRTPALQSQVAPR